MNYDIIIESIHIKKDQVERLTPKRNIKMKVQRTRRNRGGCLCCRKRKIKCDERKPNCNKCEKGLFQCFWPKNGDESLSHNTDFKLIKIDGPIKFINMSPVIENKEINKRIIPIKNSKRKIQEVEDSDQINDNNFNNNNSNNNNSKLNEDALIRQYIREAGQKVLNNQLKNKFGLEMDIEESMYYNAFVNGFIVSVSNQLAHEKLLPGSIFIPISLNDPLVRKLCITCGASFLYRCSLEKDKNILSKVQIENSIIVKDLISRLDLMPIMEIREWILIYFTLQNNRQKFMYEGRNSQTINLISGIQAIKLWIETKKRQFIEKKNLKFKINEINEKKNFNSNISTPESINDGDIYMIDENSEVSSYILLDKLVDKTNMLKSINYEMDNNKFQNDYNEKDNYNNKLVFQNTAHLVDMLEIESNMLISTIKNNNNNNNNNNYYYDNNYDNNNNENLRQYASEVSAFERTILETFIFNYSGTLLTIDKSLIKCVPSPFEVFDMIAPLLFVPLYNCAVPWMNNPTAGAALPMIELQAKIIWLSFKSKFNESDIKLIKTIQNISQYYTRPIMPDEIWISYPKNISRKLLESCYISEIVAKGIYLFSMKILNKNLNIKDLKVQEIVNSMFKILDLISNHSQTSVIAKWSFLVIGSAIIDKDKREKFKIRLLGFIDALKTGSLRTSLQFLEKVWLNNIGLDALFIEEYLDILAI